MRSGFWSVASQLVTVAGLSNTPSNVQNERRVFDRLIGMNRGVQFPIAKAHVVVEAVSLMRFKAAALFDGGLPCGAEANMTKYLASEAVWEAGEAARNALGGYGFAKEYHVERKWREAPLYRTADSSDLEQSYREFRW